tara:strand:+ start:67 stop:447 length:381 start_codon:yes stop_codon:yes gene_type:complete
MQNKFFHWLNLTAYLPVVVLQALNLMPFSTGPATVFAASVGEWTLPPPLPDHLQTDPAVCAPSLLPAARLPDDDLSSPGSLQAIRARCLSGSPPRYSLVPLLQGREARVKEPLAISGIFFIDRKTI